MPSTRASARRSTRSPVANAATNIRGTAEGTREPTKPRKRGTKRKAEDKTASAGSGDGKTSAAPKKRQRPCAAPAPKALPKFKGNVAAQSTLNTFLSLHKGSGTSSKKQSTPDVTVEHALFVFAHGAGAGQSSDWMKEWTARLGGCGTVHAFDYPYMTAGKRPPRAEKNIPFHIEQVEAAQAAFREEHGKEPFTVLIGKSMGSRIGCHVAVERPDLAQAVVCLGYPLVGMNGKTRDEVLLKLTTPTLLVQGTRDRMSPPKSLKAVLAKLKKGANVVEAHSVESGDHGLKMLVKARKEAGFATQQQAYDALFVEIKMWLKKQQAS